MASHDESIIKPFILVLLLLILTSSYCKTHPCLIAQQNALLQFKEKIILETHVVGLASWQNGTDCCMWDGVTCDIKTGDVISLDITDISLHRKTINNNSPLFLLQNLQSLNLSYNYLSGSLSSFTQLPKLLHLDLSYNFFTIDNNSSLSLQNLQSLNLSSGFLNGSLNFLFFQLPNLLHLDLSKNIFIGNIPHDTSFSTPKVTINNSSHLFPLQNLQNLNLSCNYLSGSLNFLVQFLSLMQLDLSFNEFSSIIPHNIAPLSQLSSLNISGNNFTFTSSLLEALIQNLKQIQELSLDYVRMDGVSPSSLSNLSSALTSLSISSCNLRGRFPNYIFHLPNLRVLKVSENLGLTGTLPNSNWSSPLISLDLSSTSFSGNILNSIGNLKNLQYLNLQSCHFTNLKLELICSLSSVQVLVLSGNQFSGLIPQCLGNLTDLRRLDMSLNQLMGPFPQSLSNCTLLEHVNVSYNTLTDAFPFWLGRLPNVRVVDLGQNRFYGPIGSSFNGSMFDTIILHQNDFSGHLPDFDGCLSVNVFDLSSNRLEGSIPKLPQASEFLILSNNMFTGKIPLFICHIRPNVLDLSNNSLTGTIPSCVLQNDLGVIQLGMNKLEGAIPDIFMIGNMILVLDLRGNQLKGPLPRSMVNCTGLMLLDLRNNNIEDSFPNWLETLPSLSVLALASNKFSGKINALSTDHPFPELRILDISNNSLTGLIPIEYIGQLDAIKNLNIYEEGLSYMEVMIIHRGRYDYFFSTILTVKGSRTTFSKILQSWTLIDFSNNNFQGEIPLIIGELVALKGLNLSYNNLTGSIPLSIQNLTHLEWLDLSANKLNGQIPSGLAHLTELSILNLSNNELKGMIPIGGQFNIFGMESFFGNKGLCGPQVAKACSEPDLPDQPQLLFPPTKEDDFNAFGWKIILIEYGCGLVIGVSIGYIIFELHRPKWLVSLVEEKLLKKIARSSRWRS